MGEFALFRTAGIGETVETGTDQEPSTEDEIQQVI